MSKETKIETIVTMSGERYAELLEKEKALENESLMITHETIKTDLWSRNITKRVEYKGKDEAIKMLTDSLAGFSEKRCDLITHLETKNSQFKMELSVLKNKLHMLKNLSVIKFLKYRKKYSKMSC